MTAPDGSEFMPDTDTPADDRTDESADMVADASEADPADLTGAASEETASKMHDETDEIAGHGPAPQE